MAMCCKSNISRFDFCCFSSASSWLSSLHTFLNCSVFSLILVKCVLKGGGVRLKWAPWCPFQPANHSWRPMSNPHQPLRPYEEAVITGSAVALHCCKAHAKINGKIENSTLCKIVTHEDFQFETWHTWLRRGHHPPCNFRVESAQRGLPPK